MSPVPLDLVASLCRRRAAKPPAVIFGVGSNGLSFLRSLGRRGIPVVALEAWRELGMYSRYCIPLLSPDAVEQEAAMLSFLQELGRAFPVRGVLLPTTDASVLLVSRYQKELREYYDFNVCDPDTIASLTNKKVQYDLARKLGIAVPLTLLPGEISIEETASQMGYPCLIKPYHSHLWQKYLSAQTGRRWGKLTEVHSPKELTEAYEEMSRSGLEFMVQEKVEGGDDQLYGLLTYLNRASEPLAIFTKRKLRQSPKDFGVGSFQVGLWEPEVAELGLKFLRGLKFRGLAGVEFKRDAKDGQLKLMEVNPRSISQTHHAVASGVDIPYIAYQDCLGHPVETVTTFRQGIKWLNFGLDLMSFRDYRRTGRLDAIQWIQSWRGARCYAFFTRDDPLPAAIGIGKLASDELRRWAMSRRI